MWNIILRWASPLPAIPGGPSVRVVTGALKWRGASYDALVFDASAIPRHYHFPESQWTHRYFIDALDPQKGNAGAAIFADRHGPLLSPLEPGKELVESVAAWRS